MEKLTTYFRHVREEIQKVIFPTKLQIKQAFIAVFIVVTVISIFLALVDMLMSAIVSTVVGNG
jgi:preprotein translocase subunit SecE